MDEGIIGGHIPPKPPCAKLQQIMAKRELKKVCQPIQPKLSISFIKIQGIMAFVIIKFVIIKQQRVFGGFVGCLKSSLKHRIPKP